MAKSVPSSTVMNACEYCLCTLTQMKETLLDYGSPNQKVRWAVGGLIITLNSNLLSIVQEVLGNAVKNPTPDANEDLKEIREKFNQFIDRMIAYE